MARTGIGIGLLLVVAFVQVPTANAVATTHVHVQGFSFQPGSVTISVGDSIAWDNHDGATHTITHKACPSAGGAGPCEFDSGNCAPGCDFSHAFQAAGTFNYRCNIHLFTGTIIVADPNTPDLSIDSVTSSVGAPIDGDVLTFNAQVRNAGPAVGAFTLRFTVDGVLLSNEAVGGVGANSVLTVTSDNWLSTAGTHSIKAIADVNGAVAEANEANNERTLSLSVAPVIRGVDITPAFQTKKILPLQTATYSLQVQNIGNRPDTILLDTLNEPSGWTATLSATQLTMNPGVQQTIQVTVTPPLVPLSGLVARIDVKGTSLGDPNKSDTATVETRLIL